MTQAHCQICINRRHLRNKVKKLYFLRLEVFAVVLVKIQVVCLEYGRFITTF
jgi:hypothetical protein